MNRDDYDEIAEGIDYLAPVPDDVLCEVVTRDGLCFWAFDRDTMPDLSGEVDPDRALAAAACAGCSVIRECLELELRAAGAHTVGIWGALAEDDRREVHRVWKWRHVNRRARGDEPE